MKKISYMRREKIKIFEEKYKYLYTYSIDGIRGEVILQKAYVNIINSKIYPKEFEANLNPCLIKGDRVHTILTYQLGYLSAVDLDKYKIMYDRNGENHYDMIKRDDAKNLENYNYIKNQILKY